VKQLLWFKQIKYITNIPFFTILGGLHSLHRLLKFCLTSRNTLYLNI